MKVKIPIGITVGADTADMEAIIDITPDQIAQSVVSESRGLANMHIIDTVLNVNQFFKDIPQSAIDAMTPKQRACLADVLREIAARFNKEVS